MTDHGSPAWKHYIGSLEIGLASTSLAKGTRVHLQLSICVCVRLSVVVYLLFIILSRSTGVNDLPAFHTSVSVRALGGEVLL